MERETKLTVTVSPHPANLKLEVENLLAGGNVGPAEIEAIKILRRLGEVVEGHHEITGTIKLIVSHCNLDELGARLSLEMAIRACSGEPRKREECSKPIAERKMVRLRDTNITRRTLGACRHSGLTTLGQIAERSETELLKLPRMGQRCVMDLKSALAAYDLTLGMSKE